MHEANISVISGKASENYSCSHRMPVSVYLTNCFIINYYASDNISDVAQSPADIGFDRLRLFSTAIVAI